MSSEYVTVKISKSAFEQLKEYRDKNELKSITVAIQKGVNCLSVVEEFKKEVNEQKEKQTYYEIQDEIIEKLVESTVKNWMVTVGEKNVAESIKCVIKSFNEIKKDSEFDAFENKDRIIHEVFKKYVKIIMKTLNKTDDKNDMKNRFSAMFLKQLLDFD